MRSTKFVLALGMIFISLSFWVSCGKDHPPQTVDESIPAGRPVYTEGSYIVELYQQIKDVSELFEKHGIVYWADGGTLLGATRSNGIIRWDDDIDLCIGPGEEAKFLALNSELNQLGYRIEETDIVGYHVALNNNPKGIARLDVLTTREKGGKIFYKQWPTGSREGEKIFYRRDEVFPLKDVRFGSLWIKAPHSPENYLTWQYGKSWSYEGVQDRTHRGGPVNRVRFTMTEEDLRPAEPFGPLKDRVQR